MSGTVGGIVGGIAAGIVGTIVASIAWDIEKNVQGDATEIVFWVTLAPVAGVLAGSIARPVAEKWGRAVSFVAVTLGAITGGIGGIIWGFLFYALHLSIWEWIGIVAGSIGVGAVGGVVGAIVLDIVETDDRRKNVTAGLMMVVVGSLFFVITSLSSITNTMGIAMAIIMGATLGIAKPSTMSLVLAASLAIGRMENPLLLTPQGVHGLHIEQLYIVGALTGILTVFFNVADESFLPALIPQRDLVEGNSKLGASDSLAEIAGPAVAGPLVQVVGGPVAILFDAVSFLCSALCIGLIRKPELLPQTSEQQQGSWHEITEGLRLIVGNPLLRALAGSASIFNFFGNFIGVLYILYIIRELGVAPIFVGFLIATGGISALVGALFAQRVVQRLGLGLTIGVALFIYGVTGLLTPLAHGPVVLALSLLFLSQLGDASVSIYFIAEISLRQAVIPNNLLGRVNASMQFLTRGLGPLGALLAGFLGGVLGVRLTLLIGVLGVIASGLWLLFSPVRKHTGL